jgi:hypothetical protein
LARGLGFRFVRGSSPREHVPVDTVDHEPFVGELSSATQVTAGGVLPGGVA